MAWDGYTSDILKYEEALVTPYLLVALTGLLFVLFFGGLSVLRREGISLRFTFEAIMLTGILTAIVASTGMDLNPVFAVILLYLITMRVRLLIDLGNFLARRRNHAAAEQVYALAQRLWPDESGRLLLQLNQGVLALHCNRLDEAVTTFHRVLEASEGGYLGIKSQAAGHYNLGVAYQRQGQDAQAALEFNRVLDTWPVTEYARYARIALNRRKQKGVAAEPPGDEASKSS